MEKVFNSGIVGKNVVRLENLANTLTAPLISVVMKYIPGKQHISNNTLDMFGMGDKHNKLMIIAHPDDETLFGGNELAKNKYFVVCMTNGSNSVRLNEFTEVMSQMGSKGMMLDYLDRPGKFERYTHFIEEDLRRLLEYKEWDSIVTHNPKGEYGHTNHKTVSAIVTKLANELGLYDKLNYFVYHNKSETSKMKPSLTCEEVEKKNKALGIYKSQRGIQKQFAHHMPFEDIIPAAKYGDRDFMVNNSRRDFLKKLAPAAVGLAGAALTSSVAFNALPDREWFTEKYKAKAKELQVDYVSLKDLPQHIKDAFISLEDKNFETHIGIQPHRIAKALYVEAHNVVADESNKLLGTNIKNKPTQGGSTITQQLIKQTIFSNKKDYVRKGKEITLALKLEHEFSKDEILEMYLNIIHYGGGQDGIQNAAKYYFGKPASSLSIRESASLAGILSHPNGIFNPYTNPENFNKRCEHVLNLMHLQGKISTEDYQAAKNDKLAITIRNRTQLVMP